MPFTDNDYRFMRRALELGELGKGSTFPNPAVGAVLVRDGEIIGSGFHRYAGQPHAEILAIRDANNNGFDLRGATMYVTLEPCCHHGKTPPCTQAIIEAQIARVVISCRDIHNSKIDGRGVDCLREAGIETECGLLADEGQELLEYYNVQNREKRAFLSVKWAQSIDGNIATLAGDSQWISGEKSRKQVHRLRSQHSAIAVGANTALIDNPQLTVRMVESYHRPERIVLAGTNHLPHELGILSDDQPVIVIAEPTHELHWRDINENLTVFFIERGPRFWIEFLRKMYDIGIGSVLLEGGSGVITSAIQSGLVDKLHVFIAPILVGEGTSPVNDLGLLKIADAVKITHSKIHLIDRDIYIEGKLD